jgi:hypothetical protein
VPDVSRFHLELANAQRPRASAALEADGITRGRLAGPRWHAVSRGHHRPSLDVVTPTQRILDRVPLLSDSGAFGGWAAAYAAGADELDGRSQLTRRELDVLLCLGGAHTRAKRRGVAYSYERLPESDVTEVAGIPFTSVLRSCFDGSRLAPNLREAVAFVDPVLRATRTDPELLADYVASQAPGWRGIRQARRAARLADPRSRNGWESRLRVWWVLEGWPTPEVNIPIFDLDGQLLGIADLLDVAAGTVLEFDGALHRDRRQHRKDNVREEDLEHAGLQVVRADSLDLTRFEERLQVRVERARARGLERDRRRDRWTLDEPGWWRARAVDAPTPVLTDAEKEALYGGWPA